MQTAMTIPAPTADVSTRRIPLNRRLDNSLKIGSAIQGLKNLLKFGLLVSSLIVVMRLQAEGFRNPPPGTFNLGRAGGRITHVDDSSAIAQNPANLVDLEAPEASFAPTVVYVQAEYSSPSGSKAETENPWKFLPNVFLAAPVLEDKLAAGLGITTPYGISVDWEEKGAFTDPFGLRYTAPNRSELVTINVNPSVSVKILENLRLGAGLDVMWSELSFEQYYPWAVFPGSTGLEPDGEVELKGDDLGFGGNVGLTWQIAKRHRVAVTYRSPITEEFDGEVKLNNITPTASFLGATARSDFASEIEFPTVIAVGYGIELTDKIRLGADFEWLEFSNFKTLELDLENNSFLLPSTSFPQEWDNTFTAGVGGDWRFAPGWIFRTSYQFYESPVPDHTFTPAIPDSDQHVITFGLGYRYKHHALEAAYGLDFYDVRDIESNQNPAFVGKYDFNVHLFSFSYRFIF